MRGKLQRHDSELGRLLDGIGEAITLVEKECAEIEGMPPLDVDTLVMGERVVDEQLFGLLAEDQTADDLLYHIEKALLAGVIDLSSFIKHVRNLGRQQYKTRTLIRRIK